LQEPNAHSLGGWVRHVKADYGFLEYS